MRRDLKVLRAATARVQQDLERTAGAGWDCALTSDYVLTITNGESAESVLLDADVEDESWYLRPDQTPEERQAALEADADEVVASETLEVLRVLGLSWPRCAEHDQEMGNCEGWWFCKGPPYHDVAVVGRLGE